VIEIKEHIIGMLELIPSSLKLIKLEGNVSDLVEVGRPDLADVKIDEVSVVGVDLK